VVVRDAGCCCCCRILGGVARAGTGHNSGGTIVVAGEVGGGCCGCCFRDGKGKSVWIFFLEPSDSAAILSTATVCLRLASDLIFACGCTTWGENDL